MIASGTLCLKVLNKFRFGLIVVSKFPQKVFEHDKFASGFTGESIVRFSSTEIQTRLVPLQILGKAATNTAYKARSTLRMLSLESSVDLARGRVRSILSDFGVECSLWTLPDITSPGANGRKCFEQSMPLADIDHMMHHVMLEGQDGFAVNNPLWEEFHHQIGGMSKFFSKKDHVELYIKKQVNENSRIPDYAKRAVAQIQHYLPNLLPDSMALQLRSASLGVQKFQKT